MGKLLIGFVIFIAAVIASWFAFPNFAAAPIAHAQEISGVAYPAELVIPSIGLAAPIQGVGTTSNGEMGVPNGTTNKVGWYEYGTVPGNIGSAVIDAHVFAAFANLKYLKPGSDIYVITQEGSILHFVTSRAQTYRNANVPLETLFNQSDGRYLNLITCAGRLTPDHSTYNSRLVVYAQLSADGS
jgi:sortase A